MFQGQHLAPVTKRVLGKQAQFGQAVEHDAVGIDPLDFPEDQAGRLAQLHFGGMKHRELALRIERRLRRNQFEDVDAVQRPAVPLRHDVQLALGFGQRNIEHALSVPHPPQQELKRDGGLARAGLPLVEIHPVGVEAATQDVVQPGAAGRYSGQLSGRTVRNSARWTAH